MKIRSLTGILTMFLLPVIAMGQSETYSVSNTRFSSKINDDFSPVYYRDGIVFCSNRPLSLVMNYQTPDDKGLLKIYFADTLTWKVRLFSKNLRSKFNDGPASFSKNGDTIYFSRNLKIDGALDENSPRNKLGIFTAVQENDDWVKILDVRFNNEYYNITTPYISPDGKRLFFASDNPDGYGGTDIYYCDWKTDFWSDPVNMGPEVNTDKNESYPFVNSEGGVFFASDGHPGLGGKDIFYTKQVNGKWLPPVHLDPPVNSKNDDFGLIADSVMGQGFLSSKRGKTIDIYEFNTNINQLFYCGKERINQYCFKFTDPGKIQIDGRYLQLVWNFGDGSTASGPSVEHCFKGPGKYIVRLDAIDKKSGKVVFSKLSYDLDLRDIEQPVIKSASSAMAGEPLNFDGLTSNFPGSTILNYTWYFGDGSRAKGSSLNHSFTEKGNYEVKLGLMVRNNRTGIIHQECVMKPISVFSSQSEKEVNDKRKVAAAPAIDIYKYDHARLTNFFSADESVTGDASYKVEIANSRTRLPADDPAFKKLPAKFRLKEEYLPDKKVYSYVVSEELGIMAAYPGYSEIAGLGFENARIIASNIDDPAGKDIANLKRVFGVSTDALFRNNDFNLTSTGTQLLDLVLGIMTKYPSLKLEMACHSDNTGNATWNQNLSQKRAESMVNYMVVNGVSRQRLVPRGYGGSRPIAPNYQESDRRNNRRVDFVILENK